MLLAYQTSGSRTPLFFVHGDRGITFDVGAQFAHMLGAEQPLYAINANGIDGRQPMIDSVPEMVTAYLHEIREARAAGSVRIGGMCAGCVVAIEIARALQDDGRKTGSVILVDPPTLTPASEKRSRTFDLTPDIRNRFARQVTIWFKDKKLRPRDCEKELPFDPSDPKQLHLATLVASRTTFAFAKHVPRPFAGPAEIILGTNRAPGFLHPQMPWSKLLCGPRILHVLPWSHMDLFRPGAGRKTVARLMRAMLEEDLLSERPWMQRGSDDVQYVREGLA
jgi:thioesterase domain-containing protein